jgi:hypothetical protein
MPTGKYVPASTWTQYDGGNMAAIVSQFPSQQNMFGQETPAVGQIVNGNLIISWENNPGVGQVTILPNMWVSGSEIVEDEYFRANYVPITSL